MSTEPFFPTRRDFLARTAFGVGAIALADLLRHEGALADIVKKPGENLPLDLRARAPHFAPSAKAMISLFMSTSDCVADVLVALRSQFTASVGKSKVASSETGFVLRD